MTLTELRYIVALAQEKHFGRAANRCNVSQPTLSVAIHKLESELDVALFERTKNEVRTTEIGEKIIAQALRVQEEVEKIGNLVSSEKNELSTPLKFGAIHTVAPYLYPQLIPKIKKAAPKMPLILQEDFTHPLLQKLHRGDLDAAFIALPFEQKGLVSLSLYTEPFLVLLPKTHPLNRKGNVSIKDLADETVLLLDRGHCLRDTIIEVCPSCYHPSSSAQTVEAASLETLRSMVLSGMGITILPSSAAQVRHYDRQLVLKPFKEKAPQRTIALVWRESFTRAQAINVLIQAVKECNLHGVCLI